MWKGLLAVGSTVHSMTLSYSQLPALREFPVGLAEAVHHRTLRRLLGFLFLSIVAASPPIDMPATGALGASAASVPDDGNEAMKLRPRSCLP